MHGKPKPYRSSLIPFEDEILDLRRRRPPTPYARIAELRRERHQLSVCRETIFKFVRVRSRGRKVYSYRPDRLPETVGAQRAAGDPRPNPKFEFRYSERYSLKRLPKEEAAAIRKKLEAEGH